MEFATFVSVMRQNEKKKSNINNGTINLNNKKNVHTVLPFALWFFGQFFEVTCSSWYNFAIQAENNTTLWFAADADVKVNLKKKI